MSVFDVLKCYDDFAYPSCDDCEGEELNRIIHLAFVLKGRTLDKTSASAFTADLLDAEADGDAIILRNISGTYDGGAITTGPGRGRETERVLGMSHTLTYIDPAILSRIAFYNAMKQIARNFNIIYFTDQKAWPVDNIQPSVAPTVPITDDNTTKIEGNIVVKWNKKDLALPVDFNTEALDSCPVLPSSITPVTYVLASGNYSIEEEVAGGSLTLGSSASGPLTFALDSGTLPTGTTFNTATGVLSGTPTTPGTYKFSLKVSNAYGISATKDITVIVTPAA
jgi:hypothetical protein